MYEKREATEEKCFRSQTIARTCSTFDSRQQQLRLSSIPNSSCFNWKAFVSRFAWKQPTEIDGTTAEATVGFFSLLLERNPQRLGVGMEMRSRNDDGEALASLKLSKRIARSESCWKFAIKKVNWVTRLWYAKVGANLCAPRCGVTRISMTSADVYNVDSCGSSWRYARRQQRSVCRLPTPCI